jgi:CrcB protein
VFEVTMLQLWIRALVTSVNSLGRLTKYVRRHVCFNQRMLLLAIAGGGALGAVARHLVNHAVHHRYGADPFPIGIFIVNLTGCLAIGVLAGLIASDRIQISPLLRSFLFVGVLGGFTTFSSFGLDTLTLARAGHVGAAVLNVFGQVCVGLGAVWAGFVLTHRV